MNKNLKIEIDLKINLIESALSHYLSVPVSPHQKVWEAMRYSTLNGGKRIRALLLMGIGESLNANKNALIVAASAIEMIHAYSLIHDDLPCMDNDDLRRGKPTCHKAFDEATALLAGDALLTYAFNIILESDYIDNSTKVKVLLLLSKAIGADGMIGGQCIDILNETNQIPEELLNTLHKLKTGELIRAACKIGAIIAEADEHLISSVDEYAALIGLAFQIQDDILDVIGNESLLGKPIGSDALNNKTTYVTLYGVESAKKIYEELFIKATNILKENSIYSDFILQFTEWLKNRVY